MGEPFLVLIAFWRRGRDVRFWNAWHRFYFWAFAGARARADCRAAEGNGLQGALRHCSLACGVRGAAVSEAWSVRGTMWCAARTAKRELKSVGGARGERPLVFPTTLAPPHCRPPLCAAKRCSPTAAPLSPCLSSEVVATAPISSPQTINGGWARMGTHAVAL